MGPESLESNTTSHRQSYIIWDNAKRILCNNCTLNVSQQFKVFKSLFFKVEQLNFIKNAVITIMVV